MMLHCIVGDAFPECHAVFRKGEGASCWMNLVGQTRLGARFHAWVLQEWSRQYHADLGDDVKQLISDMARPPAPSTFESVVHHLMDFANRVDEAAHNVQEADWEIPAAFEPWKAEDVHILKDGRLLGLNSGDRTPPEAPAMQVLGIDTSLVDLDYLLLRRPTVRSPDGERINLKLATADGNGLFFKCSMDT